MGLHADQAEAMRRGMLVAAAIAATLTAHAGIEGGRPGPATLMVAVALVSVACCAPGRGAAWRCNGFLRLGVLGVLLQAVLHFGIVGMPWAFGMAMDTHDVTSLRASMLAHLVAGASLAVLCWLGEQVLDALVVLARRVRRHLDEGRRGGVGTAWLPLTDTARVFGATAVGRAISRGPPLISG
ncbi:MAG: hypothetical protein U0237_15520 [Thermoleophilia bacterium]